MSPSIKSGGDPSPRFSKLFIPIPRKNLKTKKVKTNSPLFCATLPENPASGNDQGNFPTFTEEPTREIHTAYSIAHSRRKLLKGHK